MIVPGRLTLIAAAIFSLLLVSAVVDVRFALLAIPGDLLLIAIFLLQGRTLQSLNVTVSHDRWHRVQVGREEQLGYRIANRSPRSVIVRVRQLFPTGLLAAQTAFEINVLPGEIVTAALTVTPQNRGTQKIAPADVDVRFKADWGRFRFSTLPGELKIFPSLKGMRAYEQLRQNRASIMTGSHRQRMVGAGREFDQLREYTPDDDYRDINWKATARRSRPISTMYQAERSRDVMLCIDCGRMMSNPIGHGTALDHAVDAAILLAHVANRQGDHVGLVLFRDVVHRVVKPAGGVAAVQRIMNDLVDATAEPVFPSYSALIASLRAHQNRRSLVLLFTDLNDPQLAANLAEVMPLVSRKHLLIVISLSDHLLDSVADGPANDARGLFRVIAARKLVNERETRTRELQRGGAMVLQTDAKALSVELLNTYLSVKARQLL